MFFPKPTYAVSLPEALTSDNSIVVKIQEGVEYFFAFKFENKIQVLEKHAEKRLVMAGFQAENGNNERVRNLVQNYLQIKERQNNLLGKKTDGEVLGAVEERTIEQQKTMEELKTKIDSDTKDTVMDVQEKVVNQVAQRVIEVNGPIGQTEFFNKVEHVWAPGTGPGGKAGVTIEGGTTQYAPGTSSGGTSGVVVEGGTIQFAPGTSAGGPSGSDIKNVEVKTGGTVNEAVPVPNGPNYAPGTTGGSPGNTIDSGGVDAGGKSGTTNTIDP